MQNAATYRFSRIHHALQVGSHLSVKLDTGHPVRAHFRQSVMDSACGLHVLAMVLVILGLAKRTALEQMSQRKFGVAADVWRAFKETVFSGVDAREYCESIDSLNLPLQLSLRDKCSSDVDEFALESALRGELIALAFESVQNNQHTNHWSLCIGCDGSMNGRAATADTLLLLDPSASEQPYMSWNSRLSMPQQKRRRNAAKSIEWLYESQDWESEPVRLIAAVRFRLTD